jgi:hypothetical protein
MLYNDMKRFLLSAILLLFLAFQSSVLSQDVKGKVSVDLSEKNPIELSIAGDRIIVHNAPIGKKIEIFSVVGQKMAEIEIKSSNGEYPVNVPKGYYIVKIGNTVRKFVIK